MPLIRATPAMKVCDEDEAVVARRTRRCCRAAAVVWTPTGIGKVRGSTTVSETALATKNQSSLVEAEEAAACGSCGRPSRAALRLLLRRSGCRSAGRPCRCSGCRDRTSARWTMPSVSISRQRSGTGIWSVGKASGGGARIAPGLSWLTGSASSRCGTPGRRRPSSVGRRRGGGRRLARAARPGGEPQLSVIPAKAGILQRGDRPTRAAIMGPGSRRDDGCGRTPAADRRQQRRKRRRDAHFPWQTFCSFVPRNGRERAVDVAQPDAVADRDDDLVGADRAGRHCRARRAGGRALCRPRKLIMSSWSMPSPETPIAADQRGCRDRSAPSRGRSGCRWRAGRGLGSGVHCCGVSRIGAEDEADMLDDVVDDQRRLQAGREGVELGDRPREGPGRAAELAVGEIGPRDVADRAVGEGDAGR